MRIKYILVCFLFSNLLLAQGGGIWGDSLSEIEVLADTIPVLDQEIMEEYPERQPYSPPSLEPIALQEVQEKDWEEAVGGLDYSKDQPKPPKERKKPASSEPSTAYDWTGWTQGLGTFLQILAILLALGMIAYGIYWMMQAPRNRSISKDGTEITLANLDAYIHETDLERFLREALAASNWTLALRLYFLQVIKQLSVKEAIVWSKEKTNRDYLREMRTHPLHTEFRDATQQYEQVWYGNQPLSAEAFTRLEPEFKRLLEEI